MKKIPNKFSKDLFALIPEKTKPSNCPRCHVDYRKLFLGE